MGFLGDAMSKLGGQQGQEGGIAALQRFLNSSGGLSGLTSKLTSSGLGQQVQSWVGSGQNQPVTGKQIQQAVDPGQLHAVAQQAGLSDEQTSDQLAKVMPELVNQATPQGQMPASDPFAGGLDAIKRLVKI